MAEDDYDLLPHKEIVKLRNEIKQLKKQVAGKGGLRDAKVDATPSIEKLSSSINELLELFKTAGEELKSEDHHVPHENLNSMDDHLEKLNRKMDTLIMHNEEVAKGILVVAEMIKDHLPIINENTRTTRAKVESAPRQPMPPQPPLPSGMPPNYQKPVRKKREFDF